MTTVHTAGSLPPTGSGIGANVGPLPFAMNSLIGRTEETAAVVQLLLSPTVRLLTLIGSGGIGKSRLALEVGHAVEDKFVDGATLVRLAAITDPELVPILLHRALGVRTEIADERDWWAVHDRHCLLLVDNFEQVREAAPTLVDVLVNCPQVKILVTSRIPLNVSGEHEFRVPPLKTALTDRDIAPGAVPQVDAMQLFVERSIAVQSSFQLTNDNAEAVARITRHLDGLPLAIELAAAQSKHLTPEVIEQRLATTTNTLSGGPVDRPPHQRALRDTIAWSYDLLDPQMQRLFRTLSVFSGSVMPQSASYVSGDDQFPATAVNPAEDIASYDSVLSSCVLLSEHSLLVRGADFGRSPRFSLLMTIRTFGQTLLKAHGEWEEIRQRHAEWFHGMALRAAAELNGPRHVMWLDWLDIEHENLRTALDWFHQRREIHAFASLVGSLREFWHRRSHIGEGARWLQMALDMDQEEGGRIALAVRANLLNSAGWMALRQNRIDAFHAFAEESLRVARACGEQMQIASSLRLLGEVEDRNTNYAKATVIVTEANRLYRDAGDMAGVADTQASLGGLALDSGDLERAVFLFREGIDAAALAGDLHLQSRVTSALSVTLFEAGEFEEGLALSEQSLDWYEETGDLRGKAVALDHIARYLRAMDDPVRAWACHRQSLDHRWKFGETRGLVVWLETVNELLLSCGGHAASACVLGGTDGMRERGGLPIHNHEQRGRQEMLRQLERRLAPEDLNAARARGASMTLRELVDFTWSATDKAVTERVQLQADKPSSFARFDLTRREQEIAELLILRQSDREISDRLSISPRTVNAHITRILNKLGVHSRREVGQIVGDENQLT